MGARIRIRKCTRVGAPPPGKVAESCQQTIRLVRGVGQARTHELLACEGRRLPQPRRETQERFRAAHLDLIAPRVRRVVPLRVERVAAHAAHRETSREAFKVVHERIATRVIVWRGRECSRHVHQVPTDEVLHRLGVSVLVQVERRRGPRGDIVPSDDDVEWLHDGLAAALERPVLGPWVWTGDSGTM